MQHPKKSMLYLAVLVGLMTACSKNEQNVAPTDDNEAITTATLQLTNKGLSTDVVTATVDNLNGTPDFSKSALNLKANITYSAQVLMLDKTKNPVTDVSAEVHTEQNEHSFVYTPAAGLSLTVTITDKDTNPAPGPYPVGLTSEIKTGAASTGKLNVVLRHQPNAKNGTAAPGTTDLDTNFDVVIK